jgi:hypothetical protein
MFYIRTSTLSSWNDCPRREAAKIFGSVIESAGFSLRRDRMKKIVGAVIGTGVHAGAGEALKEKKSGNAAFKYIDMVDISISCFRDEIKDGVMYDDLSPNNNTCEKQIQRISKVYWNRYYPEIVPVAIEVSIKAAINDDYTLTGHPDVITENDIRDLKCGKVDRIYMPQLGGYSLLSRANRITIPKLLMVDWIPRTDIRKPQKECKTFTYNAVESEALARSVIDTIIYQHSQFLSSGEPLAFPANPYSMLCGAKWCPAYGTNWCKIKQGV